MYLLNLVGSIMLVIILAYLIVDVFTKKFSMKTLIAKVVCCGILIVLLLRT